MPVGSRSCIPPPAFLWPSSHPVATCGGSRFQACFLRLLTADRPVMAPITVVNSVPS
ncbi:MAG: hypothetical protein ACK559_12200 [bacterium]